MMKEISGFTCSIVRRKCRSMKLTVSRNGRISVYAPKRTAMNKIEDFVKNNRDFLLKSVQKQLALHNAGLFGDDPSSPFLYFLGQKLPVVFSDTDNAEATLTDEGFVLPSGLRTDEYRGLITELYRPLTLAYISKRLPEISSEVGITYTKLRISASISRWGSCSTRGTLSFSVYLICTPPRCIDHVIRHELAHIKEMNHSPRFYGLLQTMEPDHRGLQAELKSTYGKWARKFKREASKLKK